MESHPQLVAADIVLNEVGGFNTFIKNRETFLVQIAEKGESLSVCSLSNNACRYNLLHCILGMCDIEITVRGKGGHGR